MEVASLTNESVEGTLKSSPVNRLNTIVRPVSRRRPIIATREKEKVDVPLSSKRPSFNKKEAKQFSILPVLSCGMKNATTLLQQWIKDAIIHLSYIEQLPSQAYQKDAKYYPYHIKKGTLTRNV